MKVKVLKPFNDLKENKTRAVGDIFETTKERVEEINNKVAGLIEVVQEKQKTKKTDKGE